jgi:hypothetical protein
VRLAREVIESPGGQVLVYQLATLLIRLFDHVELIGDEEAVSRHDLAVLRDDRLQGPFLVAIRQLMSEARPLSSGNSPDSASSDLTVQVVVGTPVVDVSERGAQEPVIFVGASAWSAFLSVVEPQRVTTGTTTIGSLAAGTLAAAEVFKQVFADVVRGALPLSRDRVASYSLSLLTYREGDWSEPELPSQVSLDIALIGCGSIGCAWLAGLRCTPQARGRIIAVDNGRFDNRNPFKYTGLDWASAVAGRLKAVWAARRLAASQVQAEAFVGTAAEFVASLPVQYALPLVISAVDTFDARFEIQDMLARRILNAGINGTEVEVSVHEFLTGACLACLAMQSARESWNVAPLVEMLGLSERRVRELMARNWPLSAEDVSGIRTTARVPAEMLADADSFVGQPLLSFWNRVAYNEATIATPAGVQVRVTTAFVSAFAGVLLLAETLKGATQPLVDFQVNNSYRLQLLGVPAGGLLKYPRDASGGCLCASSFREAVYRQKYMLPAS